MFQFSGWRALPCGGLSLKPFNDADLKIKEKKKVKREKKREKEREKKKEKEKNKEKKRNWTTGTDNKTKKQKK